MRNHLIICLFILCLTSCFSSIHDTPHPSHNTSQLTNIADEKDEHGRPNWMMPRGDGVYKVGKPYKINGIWYFPKEDYKYDAIGVASWYGPGFHMKNTANGETFDMNLVSAAHKSLPLPCVVKVTNLENNRSLLVRVNDRGPFVNDRLIDLSRKAAELLGFLGKGTARVRVQVMPEESMTVASLAQNKESLGTSSGSLLPVKAGLISVEDKPSPTWSAGSVSVLGASLPQAAGTKDGSQSLMDVTAEMEARPLTAAQKKTHPVPKAAPPGEGSIYVQVGAFSNMDNARKVVASLSHLGDVRIYTLKLPDKTVYRVRFGPYIDTVDAQQLYDAIAATGHTDIRILME